MPRHDKPLTPDRIAAVKDADIDFSDIPEFADEVNFDARGGVGGATIPPERTTVRDRVRPDVK